MGRSLDRKATGNSDKKDMPLLGSIRKRVPCAVEEKSASKRRVKRCRHSLPYRNEAVGGQSGGGIHVCTSESQWPI